MFVLVVDDEPLVLRIWQAVLGRTAEVVTVPTVDEALLVLEGAAPPDVVVSDWDLRDPGDRDGAWLLGRVSELVPRARRVLTSGAPEHQLETALCGETVEEFLPKPVHPQAMMSCIEQVKPPHQSSG